MLESSEAEFAEHYRAAESDNTLFNFMYSVLQDEIFDKERTFEEVYPYWRKREIAMLIEQGRDVDFDRLDISPRIADELERDAQKQATFLQSKGVTAAFEYGPGVAPQVEDSAHEIRNTIGGVILGHTYKKIEEWFRQNKAEALALSGYADAKMIVDKLPGKDEPLSVRFQSDFRDAVDDSMRVRRKVTAPRKASFRR